MKVIVVLLLVLGAAAGGLYLFGGYQSFDPDKQGREAKAKIKPGMTWTAVLNVAGEGAKYQGISVSKRKIGKEVVEERRLGPKNPLSKDRLADRIQKNEVPDGFILAYIFSEQVAFDVEFDSKGVVVGVEDAATIADLLGSRKKDE